MKYSIPIRQILRNFTAGNAIKLTVSFAFCAYADLIKYPQNTDLFPSAHADYLRFRPQRVSDRKTTGSHLKNEKSVINSVARGHSRFPLFGIN